MLYHNKTDITLTVLNGGNEIILANWPNDKHIICNINSDIPLEIPICSSKQKILCTYFVTVALKWKVTFYLNP